MAFVFGNKPTLTLSSDLLKLLRSAHDEFYPGTRKIEDIGRKLRELQTPSSESIKEFITEVANWGGSSGIRNLSRVLLNSDADLVRCFAKANSGAKLKNWQGVRQTFCELDRVGFSYATKYMRFIFSEDCVVLDSVIADCLGWDLSDDNYEKWIDQCSRCAKEVPPMSCADVEASVFCFLQLPKPIQDHLTQTLK